MKQRIEFTPIGVVTDAAGPAPGEGRFSDRRETIRIAPEYVEGLTGLEPGARIMVLFYFHLSTDYDLVTFARGWQKVTGVFNSHSPRRPNGIGVTEVAIVSIEGAGTDIEGTLHSTVNTVNRRNAHAQVQVRCTAVHHFTE